MKNHFPYQLILLLLWVIVHAAETKKREISYSFLGEGQKILGKIEAEYTAKSNQECSLRCLADKECVGHINQHKGSGSGKCLLIHCTNADYQTFESHEKGEIYTQVPEAAPYWSFDTADGLIFMEGLIQKNSVPLVTGKVNKALTLDKTKSQWVDLGIHTEACMTRPETCCAAGGAISVWLKVNGCPGGSEGFISSRAISGTSGFVIYCYSYNIRFKVHLTDGQFHTVYPEPTGWTHIVLNYIGPNDGEGIKIFIDGVEVTSDTTKGGGSYPTGDGRIVVGRSETDYDFFYGSAQVDELLFFDRCLTLEEINVLATAN